MSSASVGKFGKGENIIADVLGRICTGLHCKLEDIMELIEDDVPNEEFDEKIEYGFRDIEHDILHTNNQNNGNG